MTTFTHEQQAAHCRELADKLECDPAVPGHYDQHIYYEDQAPCGTVACAMGWAAHFGIGGLKLEAGVWPMLDDADGVFESGEIVFGPGAYDRIFRSWGVHASPLRDGEADRQTVIELLRNQAALLETQPELA